MASSVVAFMIAAIVLGSILAVILVVLVGVAITIGLFRSAMHTVRRPRPFEPGLPRPTSHLGPGLPPSPRLPRRRRTERLRAV